MGFSDENQVFLVFFYVSFCFENFFTQLTFKNHLNSYNSNQKQHTDSEFIYFLAWGEGGAEYGLCIKRDGIN